MPVNKRFSYEHRGRPRTHGPRRLTGDLDRLLDEAFGHGGRLGGGGRGKKGPPILDVSPTAIRAVSRARALRGMFGGKHARRVYSAKGRKRRS